MNRVLKEFTDHMNSVTCVEFHPHEFLLASGSADRQEPTPFPRKFPDGADTTSYLQIGALFRSRKF